MRTGREGKTERSERRGRGKEGKRERGEEEKG